MPPCPLLVVDRPTRNPPRPAAGRARSPPSDPQRRRPRPTGGGLSAADGMRWA